MKRVEVTQREVKQVEPIFALDIGTRKVMGLVMVHLQNLQRFYIRGTVCLRLLTKGLFNPTA